MRLRLAGLAVALAIGGCGGNPDDAAIRQVVTDYLQAFEDGDGARACALLLPQVQRTLGDCAATIDRRVRRLSPDERAETRALRVDTVTSAGDNARVTLRPGGSVVAVRKVDGVWRIAGVPG